MAGLIPFVAAVAAVVGIGSILLSSTKKAKPKPPPPETLPAFYQYPPNHHVLRTSVLESDPHNMLDFVAMEAKRHTGDPRRGFELVASNPCIATLLALQTGDRLVIPKAWYQFVDQNLDIHEGVPLPPYPPDAPFLLPNPEALAKKSICG